MIKKSMVVLLIAATLLLTACQENNTSEITSDTLSDKNSSQENSSVTENNESRVENSDNNSDGGHQIIGSPLESLIEDFYSNHSEPEKPREPTFYYAKEEDKISSDADYDAIVSVCTDLYCEFGRLTAGKDAVLTGFTDNYNFKEYIIYMAQHSSSAEYTPTPLLDNVETIDYPQYNCVYVRGAKSSYGGRGATGIAEFIVTVRDGRLYISDCFISDEGVVFGALRSDFSAKENYDFWEKPEKYHPILEVMNNNP